MVERNGELPPLARLLASPARFLPIGAILTRALRELARRRPEVFERLGAYGRCSFLIELSDLGLAFRVVPDGLASRAALVDGRRAASDVRIRGPLLALIGLLDGTLDGDALFFSRTIAVSGRTDALLALRNAIEDAELRPSDLLGVGGRAGEFADGSAAIVLGGFQRLAGLPRQGPRP